jgi:hypothetical protein
MRGLGMDYYHRQHEDGRTYWDKGEDNFYAAPSGADIDTRSPRAASLTVTGSTPSRETANPDGFDGHYTSGPGGSWYQRSMVRHQGGDEGYISWAGSTGASATPALVNMIALATEANRRRGITSGGRGIPPRVDATLTADGAAFSRGMERIHGHNVVPDERNPHMEGYPYGGGRTGGGEYYGNLNRRSVEGSDPLPRSEVTAAAGAVAEERRQARLLRRPPKAVPQPEQLRLF